MKTWVQTFWGPAALKFLVAQIVSFNPSVLQSFNPSSIFLDLKKFGLESNAASVLYCL